MTRAWLTPRQVAGVLGISVSKVRLQIDLGFLSAEVIERPVRPGRLRAYREIRVYPEQLRAYCEIYYPRMLAGDKPAA